MSLRYPLTIHSCRIMLPDDSTQFSQMTRTPTYLHWHWRLWIMYDRPIYRDLHLHFQILVRQHASSQHRCGVRKANWDWRPLLASFCQYHKTGYHKPHHHKRNRQPQTKSPAPNHSKQLYGSFKICYAGYAAVCVELYCLLWFCWECVKTQFSGKSHRPNL